MRGHRSTGMRISAAELASADTTLPQHRRSPFHRVIEQQLRSSRRHGWRRALGAQLGQAAAEFGFGPVSVAAGASYLRRLAAADAEVRALAGACPGYARLFAPAASLPGAALWLTPPTVPARPPHAAVACVPLADWCAARLPGMRWGPLIVQGACEQHATVVPEHASCEAYVRRLRLAACFNTGGVEGRRFVQWEERSAGHVLHMMPDNACEAGPCTACAAGQNRRRARDGAGELHGVRHSRRD